MLAEDGAVPIAGGIDLVRRMRQGDRHSILVDIRPLSGLRTIEDEGDAIRIGALATHWDIETNDLLASRIPAFQAAWKTIGNVRVRMAGTVGGNLMAGEAGYDGRVLLGVAGAELDFVDGDGAKSVSAAAPSGAWPHRALLTGVRVPVGAARRIGFDRSLKPVVSVAVALDGGRAFIGVGCAYGEPRFAAGNEREIEDLADAFPEPRNNPMGSAGYRKRMIGVLAQRLSARLRGDGHVR